MPHDCVCELCASRTVEYLSSSSADVQRKVIEEFRPRQENEPDYSSLVTAVTKKMRLVCGGGGQTPRAPMAPPGPSLERLRSFRGGVMLAKACRRPTQTVYKVYKSRNLKSVSGLILLVFILFSFILHSSAPKFGRLSED